MQYVTVKSRRTANVAFYERTNFNHGVALGRTTSIWSPRLRVSVSMSNCIVITSDISNASAQQHARESIIGTATLQPMSPPRHGRRVNVRRRRRILASALALLVVVGVGIMKHDASPTTTTSLPSTTSTTTSLPTTTSTTPRVSQYAVGAITLTITEPATSTSASRSLVTTVRYPTTGTSGAPVAGATPLRSKGPYPLIVFSQGFDVTPETYARLLNAWAAAGYVVADPAYPFTSPNSPGGPIRTDIVHHPADLSYVITTLVDDSARSTGILSKLINASEIGVIGHSDGGDVTLAAIANTCCRDARIKAAVLLSGAELSWFHGTYFTSPTAPLLVVQGSSDFVYNPVSCSVDLYNQARQPKYYLSMLGQNHFTAYLPPGPAQQVVMKVTIDFFNHYLRNSAEALSAMTRAGSVSHLATITSRASLAPVAGSCPDAPLG